MSLISTTIPNLINGVSQQPFALRLPSQAEEQINGFSSVVEGLTKRPPTKHLAKLQDTPLTDAYAHTINRDTNERYQALLTNGGIKVYDLATGAEKTVHTPNGLGYLAATNPKDAFECITVADYTFIVNKEKTVTHDNTTTTPLRPYECLIWVRQGAYSTNYTANVAGVQATFGTAASDVNGASNTIRTEAIAGQLVAQLMAGGINASNGYFVQQNGSIIAIWHNTDDFTVSVTDSQSDTALKAVRGSVQRFTDLPQKAVDGFVVQIKGNAESLTDDYYVQFEVHPQTPGNGVWKECPKPGEFQRINKATMPHILVREADGSFTFRPADWTDRKVGDLKTIPWPSFVGRKLNSIFFHRNRLGLLSDENMILSEAGEFFNFFQTSAMQLVDSDPIDVGASHSKVSVLKHATAWNSSLILWSDQVQFMLGKTEALTPKTASIQLATEFECSMRARPVGAGKNVYFAVQRGENTGVREYYVQPDTLITDAADCTAHVPKYIPKNVTRLAASSNEDILVALSEQTPNVLYLYRYYWSGDEKLQSAWSKWVFSPTTVILDVGFIESQMYLTVSRPNGVFLEVISLDAGRAEYDGSPLVHLDRRVSLEQCSPVYVNGTTQLTLPYTPETGEEIVVVSVQNNNMLVVGQVIPHTRVGRNIQVQGTLTLGAIGVRYAFRYKLSPLLVREQAAGGGMQPVQSGRLQVRNVAFTYANTGNFRVEVTPLARETYTYGFSGITLGQANAILGRPVVSEGQFTVPVMSKNDQVTIEIINDSHLPCAFLSAEWEGFFVRRSRRI